MRIGTNPKLPSYPKSYEKKDFARLVASKNSSLEEHKLTKQLAFELSLESKKTYPNWWSSTLSANLEENLLPAINLADISIDGIKLADMLKSIAKKPNEYMSNDVF